MTILVIDGQGGKLGKLWSRTSKKSFPAPRDHHGGRYEQRRFRRDMRRARETTWPRATPRGLRSASSGPIGNDRADALMMYLPHCNQPSQCLPCSSR